MSESQPPNDELRRDLLRAAVHAFTEHDADFFLACERRWARRFAPDGPTIFALLELRRELRAREPAQAEPPRD